jgi:hypothetical protein
MQFTPGSPPVDLSNPCRSSGHQGLYPQVTTESVSLARIEVLLGNRWGRGDCDCTRCSRDAATITQGDSLSEGGGGRASKGRTWPVSYPKVGRTDA